MRPEQGTAALRRAPRAAGRRARPAVTLVELMIAMSLVSIGILAMVQSFGFIQKAIQASKNRTLASNLAQEKMQILKQKNYYQVLVTSDPAHNSTDFAPDTVDYDTGYFPPEDVTEAGVTYTRYTYVQVAREDSGELKLLSPTVPDTGMKLITVTVAWSQGGIRKKLSVRSILANPDTVMSNSVLTGTVRDATGLSPIHGALVNVAENMGWRDTTGPTGAYSINVLLGNYNMVVTAEGYYPLLRSVSIAANATQTQNFDLVKIATGSISGSVWLRDHPVISQVVGSTVSFSGFDQEYVELFNPTTFTWLLNGNVGLKFQRPADPSKRTVLLTFVNSSIAPGGYFLFANTGTITAGGVTRSADAVWSDSNSTAYFPYFAADRNVIPTSALASEGGGALQLYRVSDDSQLDAVGWDRNGGGQAAPFSETDGIDQNIGLETGEQYVRYSSTAGISSVWGRAYDSNNNSVDFHTSASIVYPPYDSASGMAETVSGTPAAGAVITCTDGVSSSTEAWLTGTRPYATFTLVDVATGTWTLLLSSGALGMQDDTAGVLDAGAVYRLPSTATVLSQEMTTGLISGRVLNAYGAAISPGIVVSPGGAGSNTTASVSNGRYVLRVSTGFVDVTANPSSAVNASYVTLSSNSVPVELGQAHSDVDFVLYQGGKISGFVTRDGVNALPGVAVAIIDVNGLARDQQVTGLDGRFTTMTLSTGAYSVTPAISSREMATPDVSSVTLTVAGVTKFSSTFTVSGAMGYITGSVTRSGSPIKTGVLIVVTTTTLPGTSPEPPALSTATLSGSPFYIVSSMENGTFRAEVTQSTSPKYNVYAFFPTPVDKGSVTLSSKVANVQVLAGQTTTGVNFGW